MHFYEDYADSIECTSEIKSMCSAKLGADAAMTLLLEMYSVGMYGQGTASKAIYYFEDLEIAIMPNSEGKLIVSVN